MTSRRIDRRGIGRVLLAVARDDPLPPVERLDRERLVRELEYHRLAGLAARRAAGAGWPRPLQADLQRLQKPYRLRMLLLKEAWRRAREAMAGEGIEAVVVKGPILTDQVYAEAGARLYQDLDVIVPRGDFERAVRALEAAGFAVADRNWALIRSSGAGELKLALPQHGVLDLHWHLLFTRDLRARFPIDMDELLERAREVRIGDTTYRTLDPVDSLLHLAVHAGREGADRLIWLKDIEQSVRRYEPDWDELVRRALGWQVQLLAGTVLVRARETLGAPVPHNAVRALLGSRLWYGVVTGVARAFPAERTRERGSPVTLLARASSRSVPATFAEALRGVASRLLRVMTKGDWQRDEASEDPSDPGSLLYQAGGPEARRAFFRELAEEDEGSPSR